MNRLLCFLVFFAVFLPGPNAYATKIKPYKTQEEADAYLLWHYNAAAYFYGKENWAAAADKFEKVIYFFPDSDAAAESAYYLAVCYYGMKEYDFANKEFSNYLTSSYHPAFFEDAVEFKFCIAEHLRSGKKRHALNFRYFPKCMSAYELALTIYDEVIAALPNHELTIRALQSKAELLQMTQEYRECIETYQLIIRRFPKHEIVPICYLKIAEAYFLQSRFEFQNPDILALAEINVRKFREDFPRDERIAEAEEKIAKIKEWYAKGLCDLGAFYERINKPEAAVIYYRSSIEEFPETRIAQYCRCRLVCLGAEAPDPEQDSCTIEMKEEE